MAKDIHQKPRFSKDAADQVLLEAVGRMRLPETPDLAAQKAAIAAKIAAHPEIKPAFWKSPGKWIPVFALPLLILGAFLFLRPKTSSPLFYEAHVGNQVAFVLEDGSHIDLRGNSQLSLEPGFGTSHRHVQLEGEAFFRVKKGTLPFIIQIGEAKVTVLGTAFNINQRDSGIAVHVTEGKVAFSSQFQGKESQIQLQAGESAQFLEVSGFQAVTPFRAEAWPLWKQHIYQFEGETLTDICRELENDFNVSIHIANDLKHRLVSGRISSENVADIMDLVAALVEGHWTKQGRQINLNPSSP